MFGQEVQRVTRFGNYAVDTMRAKRKTMRIIVCLMLIGSAASADTTFLTEKPANPIKIGEAVKLTTPVQQCRQVVIGKNGAPVVKPGTENSFHTTIPKGIENALDVLTDGKSKVYRCQEMEYNKDKMKFARLR